MNLLYQKQKLLVFLLLIFSHVSCANTDCEIITKINTAINQGKPVAIIITDPSIKEDIQFSDAYGDWVHYWNDFITDTKNQYLHIKLIPSQLPGIFSKYKDFEKSISYVFLNKNSAFYYAGTIYEPQVFSYIQLQFAGKSIPKDIAPFKPEQTEIVLWKCK